MVIDAIHKWMWVSEYGGNIPMQKLSVYRWPENVMVAYAFADPDAERLGLHTTEFEVGVRTV